MTTGWREYAPFDAILVTAAAPALVAALIGQLGEGGRLIAPVGGLLQSLVELRKAADGSIEETVLAPVSFVPLLSGVLD
jgi:protein-L-isoaspartate(D-aspartate) O-methyltransferase